MNLHRDGNKYNKIILQITIFEYNNQHIQLLLISVSQHTAAVQFSEIENAFRIIWNLLVYIRFLIQFLAVPRGQAVYSAGDVSHIIQRPQNENILISQHCEMVIGCEKSIVLRSAHYFLIKQAEMLQPLLSCLFFLSLSSVCVVLPRAPSPSPGGAGPVRSDARGPAGQMEAAASDVFRNLQRGQRDWLRRVHKGTKGTEYQSESCFSVLQIQFLEKGACAFLSCDLYEQCSIAISWRNYIMLISSIT